MKKMLLIGFLLVLPIYAGQKRSIGKPSAITPEYADTLVRYALIASRKGKERVSEIKGILQQLQASPYRNQANLVQKYLDEAQTKGSPSVSKPPTSISAEDAELERALELSKQTAQEEETRRKQAAVTVAKAPEVKTTLPDQIKEQIDYFHQQASFFLDLEGQFLSFIAGLSDSQRKQLQEYMRTQQQSGPQSGSDYQSWINLLTAIQKVHVI